MFLYNYIFYIIIYINLYVNLTYKYVLFKNIYIYIFFFLKKKIGFCVSMELLSVADCIGKNG